MELAGPYLALLAILFIIVLAARQMGDIFARFKLPLISGFLFVGIIAGPFVLDFVHTENIPQFLILDELCLAFIAFAAGGELELHVIRGYFRSIISIISGQVVAVFALGIAASYLIQDIVPFMVGLPQRAAAYLTWLYPSRIGRSDHCDRLTRQPNQSRDETGGINDRCQTW